MLIALDWDGTAGAAPELFALFIAAAKGCGHQVLICTMRTPAESDGVGQFAESNGVDVVYTSRAAKAAHMQALGLGVDIWIDDRPAWIFQDG